MEVLEARSPVGVGDAGCALLVEERLDAGRVHRAGIVEDRIADDEARVEPREICGPCRGRAGAERECEHATECHGGTQEPDRESPGHRRTWSGHQGTAIVTAGADPVRSVDL